MRVHGGIQKAFALPVVLTTSLVMMLLLLIVLSGITSSSALIANQTMKRLSSEAAESGINFVMACIKNGYVPSGTYTETSQSCDNATPGTAKYLIDTASSTDPKLTKLRNRFSVTVTTSGGFYVINATGYVDIYRTGGSAVVESIPSTVKYTYQYLPTTTSSSSSGSLFVCAIVNSMSRCWGRNTFGELGNGGLDSAFAYYGASSTPPAPRVALVDRTTGLKSGGEIEITAGQSDACAITTTANDMNYYINNPSTNNNPASNPYMSNRSIACWGTNSYGELGNNQAIDAVANKPVLINSTNSLWKNRTYEQYPKSITSSTNFVCALTARQSVDTTNGNTYCWGRNNNGQLGNNNHGVDSRVPVIVRTTANGTTGLEATDISAAADSATACARRLGGNAVCWGNNSFGQIGNNNNPTDAAYPAVVVDTSNTNILVASTGNAIATGGSAAEGGTPTDYDSYQSCAVTTAATTNLYCWGTNDKGQLGKGVMNTSVYPRANQVALVQKNTGTEQSPVWTSYTSYIAYKVAVANETVCAVVKFEATDAYYSIVCSGGNRWGELGRKLGADVNNSDARFKQVNKIRPPMSVASITGGGFRFCAVASAKNYCWGRNHVGQIGDGSATYTRDEPTESKFLDAVPPVLY